VAELEARIKELEDLLEQEKNNLTKGNEALMDEIRKLKQQMEDMKVKARKDFEDMETNLNLQK
jgi:prefoldin subunit 5